MHRLSGLASLAALTLLACDPSAIGTPGPEVALSFPQAVGGALLVNPDVFPAPTLRIAGETDELTVELAGRSVVAVAEGEVHAATLDVSGLADGTYTVTAHAKPRGSAEVELVVSRSGAQLTFFDEAGAAATPRLHRAGDKLLLTWADRREGNRRLFLAELDGAGRMLGGPVALTSPSIEALYARALVVGERVYIHLQTAGGPYTNQLLVTDLEGSALFGPVALDPEGTFGSFGGALAHDGAGAVVVFRSNSGNARSDVYWARLDDETLELAGPVAVAGDGDVELGEGFEPFTFLSLVAADGDSVVAFTRKEHDANLDLAVPVARFMSLNGAGELTSVFSARRPNAFPWHHEARVLDAPGGVLPLWTEADLTSPENNPPVVVFSGAASTTGDFQMGQHAPLVNAPGHRGEVALAGAELAWLDERTLVTDDEGAKIELRVAPLSAPDRELVFRHAVFIAGTSQLGGVESGPGSVLTWLDERHGQGLFDPRPEVWFEVVWR